MSSTEGSTSSEVNVLGTHLYIAKGKKIVVSIGKRKTSIAKAVIRAGVGRFRVNSVPVEIMPIEIVRLKIMEPYILLSPELRNSIDIEVESRGGGNISQAYAIRTAVARGIIAYFGLPSLKELFKEYDRTMLAGDPRRTEPEKWMRYSARRFRQKSYR